MTQASNDLQVATDTILATGALATPLWLQGLEDGLHVYVLVGGSILLTLRVIKTFYDIRKARKKENKDGDRPTP